VKLSVDDEACQLLLDRGFDPKYGARPLRRTIQKMVEDRLADMILEGSLTPGDCVSLARDKKRNADDEPSEMADIYELKFTKEADAAKV
jgi:ATP-dependent Clp protease ATP-binding subunit ClpA